jgi:Fic-DOC domain mobile mystery protein B
VERAVTALFREPDDATPLTREEREGLLQTWITHRHDLNEAEQANILKASAWVRRRKNTGAADLLTEGFANSLHRRMFDDVWRWAGSYRRSERNIGIAAYRIPMDVPMMLDDVRFWIQHRTYEPDEIAVRFHHKLVAIHPFPNGNGRHARLMADLLAERLDRPAFTWGGGGLATVGEFRARYITALRAADNHDIGPLLEFARS